MSLVRAALAFSVAALRSMPSRSQKLRLFNWAKASGAHGLDGTRQRLEIYMSGQVEMTGRSKRVGISVLADGL